MRTEIITKYQDTQRGLTQLQKSQYPYALAKSLTKTAKGAQGAVRRSTESKFDLHGKFVKTNIRITPALKSDIVRFNLARAQVRTDKRISKFMVQHEPGALRRPRRSKTIAVPGPDLPKNYRGRSGRVLKKYQPATLLANRTAGKKGSQARKRSKKNNAFIINAKDGTSLIVRRVGKARKPLELLYILKKKVDIKRWWRFERTVKKFASVRFRKNFERSMKSAVASIK